MTMKSKKSGGYSPKYGRRLAVLRRAAHERLEDREEEAAVLRHLALLADVVRVDPHQRIFGEGGEGVVGLVGEDVAVGEEQDARAARRLAAQVPAAVEELPGDLEGDEGLAGAGGEREQDARRARRRSLPARARRRCPGSSGSGASRPCPRTARRRSGRARRSASAKVSVPELVRRRDSCAPRLPCRSACRCRRCPGRWWRR